MNTYGTINNWSDWKKEHANEDWHVFVFGSNPVGINGNPIKGTGGAALIAQLVFGVRQGEKMNNCISESGEAYGLVTVTYPGKKWSLSKEQIKNNILLLFETCEQYQNKQFNICYDHLDKRSLNGYTGYEMISMFIDAKNEYGKFPENLYFSEAWKNEIEKRLNNKINNLF